MGENERQWGVGQKELEGESRRWRGRMRHGERETVGSGTEKELEGEREGEWEREERESGRESV